MKAKTQHTDPLLLDNQLCFPLYAASRLVTRLYQPLLEPLGLTYPQYVVLLILWEEAPCSVSHIGARAFLNSNTLTPLIKRLESLGYVNRIRSKEDERLVEIHLTKSGASLRSKCACIPEQLAKSTPFPIERAGALKVELEALINSLKETLSAD